MSGVIAVLIDDREPESMQAALRREAERVGGLVAPTRLPFGDFGIWHDELSLGVERKEVKDLLNSLSSGRLQHQIEGLVEAYRIPGLVVEGDVKASRLGFLSVDGVRTRWTEKSVRGYLLALQLRGVRVWATESKEGTARLIFHLGRLLAGLQGSERQVEAVTGVGLVALPEPVRALAQIRGIGPDLAQKLWRHFGTLRGVAQAAPQELGAVPGMGAVRVRQLWSALEERAPVEGGQSGDETSAIRELRSLLAG